MAVGKSKMQIQKWQDKPAFWFSDLNTGNNTYKQYKETGALAIGPMLQGLNKPVMI
jgi:phosphate acetyltransferase